MPGPWKDFAKAHTDASNRGFGKYDPNDVKFKVKTGMAGGLKVESTHTSHKEAQDVGYMGNTFPINAGVENEIALKFPKGCGPRITEVSAKNTPGVGPQVTIKAGLAKLIDGLGLTTKVEAQDPKKPSKAEVSATYKNGPMNGTLKYEFMKKKGGLDVNFELANTGAIVGGEVVFKKQAMDSYAFGFQYGMGGNTMWGKHSVQKQKDGKKKKTCELKLLNAGFCSTSLLSAQCSFVKVDGSEEFSIEPTFACSSKVDATSDLMVRLDLGDRCQDPALEVSYTNKINENLAFTPVAYCSFNQPLHPKVGFQLNVA